MIGYELAGLTFGLFAIFLFSVFLYLIGFGEDKKKDAQDNKEEQK